jgi:DNA methylase
MLIIVLSVLFVAAALVVSAFVRDPFVGSGTTGVVAMRLNRCFLVIDIINSAVPPVSALPIAVSGRRIGEMAPTTPQGTNWHNMNRPSAIPVFGM